MNIRAFIHRHEATSHDVKHTHWM